MKPILFLVFNRPDVTKKAFDSIRDSRPNRLFVAGDGPRPDRPNEKFACDQTREIATQVDWDCDVKTLFRDENLGCERAVSSAITWFFEHVESGIILEDDCVADPTFFEFCGEMLDRYADNPNIGVITGNNFQRGRRRGKSSYYFSKYPHCWGWASWRQRWQAYDEQIATNDDELKRTLMNFSNVSGETRYWTNIFQKTRERKVDSWAYRWTYAVWKQRWLTVTPQTNLVENIGFGPDATHTTNSKRVKTVATELKFPLTHPDKFVQNKVADAFAARNHFQVRRLAWLRKLYRTLRKSFKS